MPENKIVTTQSEAFDQILRGDNTEIADLQSEVFSGEVNANVVAVIGAGDGLPRAVINEIPGHQKIVGTRRKTTLVGRQELGILQEISGVDRITSDNQFQATWVNGAAEGTDRPVEYKLLNLPSQVGDAAKAYLNLVRQIVDQYEGIPRHIITSAAHGAIGGKDERLATSVLPQLLTMQAVEKTGVDVTVAGLGYRPSSGMESLYPLTEEKALMETLLDTFPGVRAFVLRASEYRTPAANVFGICVDVAKIYALESQIFPRLKEDAYKNSCYKALQEMLEAIPGYREVADQILKMRGEVSFENVLQGKAFPQAVRAFVHFLSAYGILKKAGLLNAVTQICSDFEKQIFGIEASRILSDDSETGGVKDLTTPGLLEASVRTDVHQKIEAPLPPEVLQLQRTEDQAPENTNSLIVPQDDETYRVKWEHEALSEHFTVLPSFLLQRHVQDWLDAQAEGQVIVSSRNFASLCPGASFCLVEDKEKKDILVLSPDKKTEFCSFKYTAEGESVKMRMDTPEVMRDRFLSMERREFPAEGEACRVTHAKGQGLRGVLPHEGDMNIARGDFTIKEGLDCKETRGGRLRSFWGEGELTGESAQNITSFNLSDIPGAVDGEGKVAFETMLEQWAQSIGGALLLSVGFRNTSTKVISCDCSQRPKDRFLALDMDIRLLTKSIYISSTGKLTTEFHAFQVVDDGKEEVIASGKITADVR